MDSQAAGRELGEGIARSFGGERPQVVVLFASSRHDYHRLLDGLHETCRPERLVGCSSAGEFTDQASADGAACALALSSDEMEFSVAMTRGITTDAAAAAKRLATELRGLHRHDFRFHTALVLTDALAGHVEPFVEQLTVDTAGTYQLFGGGAGDDGHFQQTHVFCDREVATDAAVVLEILSLKPIGIGVAHGWHPSGPAMRVTEASGNEVVSLNAVLAVDTFEQHALSTRQKLDRAAPLPFFLHNVLGVETGNGYKLRVPLGVRETGAVAMAAEVPVGSSARIMSPGETSAAEAAAAACHRALEQLRGEQPKVAFFFDCAATRLRLGKDFGLELEALGETLKTPFAGCNTYGQIARAEGQFNGFHNCTAVVCILPD